MNKINQLKRGFIFIILCFLAYILFISFILNEKPDNHQAISSRFEFNLLNWGFNDLQDYQEQETEDTFSGVPHYGKTYLVNTKSCKIIRWPIFDEQTLPLFENKSGHRLNCDTRGFIHNFGDHDNFYIDTQRYNYTGIKLIKHDQDYNLTDIECYAHPIQRNDSNDNLIIVSENGYILDKNVVNYFPNQTLLDIKCLEKGKITYQRAIPLIPDLKTDVRSADKDVPNVLFVGFDSVSRVHFERHFPLTIDLLSKHRFYTLYGYNKVADNTFPNLTPLLTGLFVEDLWNETIGETFNYFPFIWKDFKRKGYKTLLIEDFPGIATYNYVKTGFGEQPTDYYLRPFGLSIEDDIKDNCYHDKPEIEVYYEYLKDFIEVMHKRNDKYFAFTFMTRLTHNELNNAGLADPLVAHLFSDLFDKNLLTNTVVVFFSDHGIRYGPIRETFSGKVEERMPFMHLYVPEKWRNSNLTLNQNRLTTPFEIHATLRHILEGKPDLSLKYGQSLLEEISEERSCQSIHILEHWCSCQSSDPISNLTKVEPISQFIVKSVNELIAEKYGTECVHLALDMTLSAFEQHLSDNVLRFDYNHQRDVVETEAYFSNSTVSEVIKNFLVTLRVRPSGALFEATVSLNENNNNMRIIGEVSRINLYGNQSDCIDSSSIKRYCFCKNHLKN